MHLLIAVFYHPAGLLRCPNAAFSISPQASCRTWVGNAIRSETRRVLSSGVCSTCGSFLFALPQAKAAPKGWMRLLPPHLSHPPWSPSVMCRRCPQGGHRGGDRPLASRHAQGAFGHARGGDHLSLGQRQGQGNPFPHERPPEEALRPPGDRVVREPVGVMQRRSL